MIRASIIARNDIKLKIGDRLRAVKDCNCEFGEDIMITGPGGFLAYPDVQLYLEFYRFFGKKTGYNDYELCVYDVKEENTYTVLLTEKYIRD